MNEPLSGIKVVAFEQAVAMPFCSFVLAELGAEVIKIEHPVRGDVIRGWDSAVRGLSTGFVWVNANKKDVTVDVSRPEGVEIVQRLASSADVFLENFTPGVVERRGLGYEHLKRLNPGLIYCSLSGYGQTGPYSRAKAYDLLIQGESGMLLSSGYPDAPAKIGIPVADLVGGTTAAIGVLAALYERKITGEGKFIDVSMFDSALLWLGYYPQHYWETGAEPPRSGMRHQYICPYGPFLALDDRYVNLAVVADSQWKAFCCDVIERPELADDERFRRLEARTVHREDLDVIIADVIRTRPHDVWLRRLLDAGLPCGDVRNIGEVLSHPQTKAREMIVKAHSPVGLLSLVRFPLADPSAERRIPALGEDTDAVLERLGYLQEAIQELHRSGVV